MLLFIRRFLLTSLGIFLSFSIFAQFTVNTSVTAMAMAQELVGPGVEVISATYSGDPSSKGIFAATGTSLPMTNGVVLSTGYVTNIAGNASAQASTSTSGGTNDPDLKTLVNNCANCVKDVAYLEFQFKAIGTEINFDFVFGSEEYPEYVCSSYNDVFGFFISGPGITGKKNLALVPGTTIPVAINTINSGTAGTFGTYSICLAACNGNPPYSQYYIDNSGSTTIKFDGLTTTLTAHQEIQTCEIYTIKLAIADITDRLYDSGVFIKSNSFSSEVPTLSIDATTSFPTCPVDPITFTSTLTGADPPINYFWFVNGIEQNVNSDQISINGLQNGDVVWLVVSADINCSGTKLESNRITINFLPYGQEELNVSICEGDSYTFNGMTYTSTTLGVKDTVPDPPNCDKIITLNLTVNPNVTPLFPNYGPFCQGDTPPGLPNTSTNGITGTWNPSVINTSIPGTTSYTFTPDGTQCSSPVTIDVTVDAPEMPNFNPIGPFCKGDTAPGLPTSSTNGITGTWSPSVINTSTSGIFSYTFTPTSGLCADIVTINIEITEPIVPSFDPIGPLCQGDPPPSLPNPSNDNPGISGKWVPGTINTTVPGTFTFNFIPNSGQCALPTSINITIEPKVTPTFNQLGPYCKDETPDPLPISSSNGVSGTWNPSTINTSTPGSYTFTFTPDAGECAEGTTMTIVIETPVIPVFNQLGPFCKDDVPPTFSNTSNNGISGSWNPAIINTSTPGTFSYTFTPDVAYCAEPITMDIVIDPPVLPTFNPVDPLCQNSTPIVLPNTSTNNPAITGTWSPANVNTSTVGTFTYTFTPTTGQCALPATLDITIKAPITPTFNPIGPLCQNQTPPTLPNNSNDSPSVNGSWSPSTIDVSQPGIFTFNFTPSSGECALSTTMDIEITPEITPTFDQLGPYCQNEAPDPLSNSSTDNPAITGTWNPAVISTADVGTSIYTFTPDAGICAKTITMTITVTGPTIPVFNQLGPYCKGSVPDDLPISPSNDASITGTWNPAVINTSTSGTFTYTFTPDAGLCAATATMTITINEPTLPTFDPINPLCKNDTPIDLPTTSTNNPAITGTWSPSQVNTGTSGTFTFTFTPDAAFCALPTTMDITIEEPIIPSFSAIGPLCQNHSAPSLPGTSNDSPPVNGNWSPSLIDVSQPGTFTYTFTPIAGECALPTTLDIEVNPEITTTFDPLGPYCLNETPDLLPTSSTNSPAITGTWSPAVITTTSSGTFTYIFTPDGAFCASPYTMTITVTDPLQPVFDPIGPYCKGDSPDNLPTSPTNDPSITGTWNPATISTSTSGTFTYTFTPDAGFCATTASLSITIEEPVLPTFNPIGPLCKDAVPINLPSISTNTPGITGTWNPSTISTSTSGTFTYTFTPDDGLCALPTSINITIDEPIVTTFNPIGPLCQFSNPPTLPNFSTNAPSISGTWSPSVIQTSVPGIFTYTFTPGPAECATPFSMDIEIKPQVLATFTQLGPYCMGDIPDLLNTSSENDPPITGTWNPSIINTSSPGSASYTFTPDAQFCSPPYTMTIYVDKPSSVLFQPIDPICQNTLPPNLPSVSDDNPPVTGSWVPAVIITSTIGTQTYTFYPDPGFCKTPTSIQITIYQPPMANFSQLGPYCQFSPGATLPVVSNDNPPVTGTWNPAVVNTSTIGTQTYIFTPDPGQCASTTQMSITVVAPTTPTFIQPGPYCYGDIPADLPTASTNNPPIYGSWSPSTINTSIIGPSQYTFTPYDNECANPTTITVDIKALPDITINPVQNLCKDSAAITLTATPTGGIWSGTNVNGNIFNPLSVGQFTVTYTFTDPSGCTNLSTINITVDDCSCQDPASVDAGPDGSICIGGVYNVSGQIWTATSAVWSTSGSGVFGDPNSLNTTYTPSAADIAAGSVILTLTTQDHDGNGPCSPVSDQMKLTITNTPVSIIPISPLCDNDQAVELLATPVNGIWDGPGVIGNYFYPDVAQAGTHIITYTLTGGCIGSSSVTITVKASPIVTINPIDTLCTDDAPVTLTGTPAGGTFFGSGVNGSVFTPSIPGTFTIEYLYTNSNICSATASTIAVVKDCNCHNPVIVNAGPDLVFCPTGAQIISGTGNNAASYQWTSSGTGIFGSPNSLTTTYTPSAEDVSSGSITLTLTGMDPDGNGPCEAASDQVIITFDVKTIVINPINPMCLNASPVTLSATPAGGTWTGNGVNSGVFNPSEAGAGSHTITYTIDGNCPVSKTITIIVNPLPVIAITPVNDLCLNGLPVQLFASPSGGIWSGPNVTGDIFNPIVVGNFTLTYSYTNSNGCANSKNIVVKVTDCSCINPATSDAGIDDVVCAGSSYTLSGTITVATQATWTSSGTGTFDNPNLLNATYTPSQSDIDNGSVVLTLTTEDPDGDGPCSPASDEVELTIINVKITLTPQSPLCEDATPVTLIATPQGGTWSGPGITNGNTFDPEITGPGTFTVQYSVGGTCPKSDAMFIVVNPLPVLDITPVPDLCLDDPAVTLTATPSGGTWSGQKVTGNIFTPSSVGTFTVKYSYTNNNGCHAEKTINIKVNDCGCLDPVTIDVGADQSICAGEVVNLSGTFTNATSLSWTTSGDGSFDNISGNPVQYTPGTNDILSGTVHITATTNDPDGNGPCHEATDQVTITINKTIISFAQVDPLCINAGSIPLIATPNGGVFSGNGVTGNSFDPAVAGVGAHTISYHVGGNCPADKSITIIVNPLPVPVINPVGPLCKDDDPVTLSATPAGGVFSGNNVNNGIFTPGLPGTYTIKYTYTDGNGCTGQNDLTIKVNDCGCLNPATADAGSNTTICSTEKLPLYGTVTVATGGQWTTSGDGSFDNPNLLNTLYTPGPNDILNGSVVLILTTLDPDGAGPCNPVSDAITITITELIIKINPVPDVCIDGKEITLSGTPLGGIFSGPGVTGNIFDPAKAGVGNHIITYTIEGNCPGSVDFKINVLPLPDVTINPISNLCVGDSAITLTANPPGGVFTGQNVSGDRFDPVQPGVYTITYTYTNNAGCVNSSSVDIQVADCGCADPASADAGKDITICEGETVTLTGNITNAPGAVWSSNGTGLFSDANALSTTYEPSVTDIKKGSVKITLTTLDPDGNGPCHPYSDQLTITIIPLPKVSIITPPNEICLDGAILTLIATPQGGTWSGNGVSNDKFDPANAGIGDHKLTYTYINGTCKGEDSFTITVKDCGCNTLVNVNAGPDINICDLQPVTLIGSVNGNFPVVWSTNGTGTFSDRYSAVTQYTPTEADREKQIISFTITSPDPDGEGPCEAKTDMMSLSITTLMDVNLKIDDTDCGHDRGSVTVLPPASNRFIFSVDNGNTFTDLPVFGDLAPGNYSLIYKDPISGCQSSKNFTINPPPLVAAQWRLITKACAPVESNFIDIVSTQNLTLPLDIYLDDKYTLTTATLPVKIDHLEIGKHTLKIKDANGCIVNDNFEITESSTIDVDILPVYVVDEGESAVLIPQINGPYTSIVWTPADYLSCTQCPTPTTTPDREITYLVTVTNQQGCEDSIDVRIIIRKKIDVFVPNIFTPNGDGLNDFVTIFTDSHIKIIDNLKIFSRWGELVFERSNFLPNIEAEGWDGNFRGQAMNPAVFAWVATINIPGEGIRIFKGDVTLIR